jgi:rSAM/selenodomain-associated transferase 2
MSVSVIIPTLEEAAGIADAIRSVRELGPHEIIVADGGSQDQTLSLAHEADLVLRAPRGRASQMNAGAAQATGKVLLFLHADCSLEEGSLTEACRLLDQPGVAAGCFSMRVRAEGKLYRLIDACASARVRLTGLIYGDQGLFLRRADFHRWGGFPVLPFMEDLFFSRTLSVHGRMIVASSRIYVSPRRWQRSGVVRQTLRNWTLTTLAALGVPPARLARHYPHIR